MNDKIRNIIKEAFALTPSQINVDKNFFANVVDKPSNLGCLEFKYSHDEKEVDQAVKELTPFLNDLGIKFISVVKMTNTLILTVTKQNAEEAKKICEKFGFSLSKEGFSDSPSTRKNFAQDPSAPSMKTHSTDYGRAGGEGKTSFSGGVLGGNFAVDRLAGE